MCMIRFLIIISFIFSQNIASEENLKVIRTANNTGSTFTGVYDPISQAYVEFAARDLNPTLEIGAGRGATVTELVKQREFLKNSANVVVNDISNQHLNEALKNYPNLNNTNVTMLPGAFPWDLNFPKATFNSILTSRVFHFLTPEEWQTGLNKIFIWLKEGGRLYITTGSYFIPHQKDNIKLIETKKESGVLWPATFKSGKEAYGPDSHSGFANLVDKEILERELKLAGFEILQIDYLDFRDLLPADSCLDGREVVEAIAIKPIREK